jgi:hypothetical protein
MRRLIVFGAPPCFSMPGLYVEDRGAQHAGAILRPLPAHERGEGHDVAPVCAPGVNGLAPDRPRPRRWRDGGVEVPAPGGANRKSRPDPPKSRSRSARCTPQTWQPRPARPAWPRSYPWPSWSVLVRAAGEGIVAPGRSPGSRNTLLASSCGKPLSPTWPRENRA